MSDRPELWLGFLGNRGRRALHGRLPARVPCDYNNREEEQSRENTLTDIQEKRAEHKANHADCNHPTRPAGKGGTSGEGISDKHSSRHEQQQSDKCSAEEGSIVDLVIEIERVRLSCNKHPSHGSLSKSSNTKDRGDKSVG